VANFCRRFAAWKTGAQSARRKKCARAEGMARRGERSKKFCSFTGALGRKIFRNRSQRRGRRLLLRQV
jgi:hypothetical protein